jgi:hypothetical protein
MSVSLRLDEYSLIPPEGNGKCGLAFVAYAQAGYVGNVTTRKGLFCDILVIFCPAQKP